MLPHCGNLAEQYPFFQRFPRLSGRLATYPHSAHISTRCRVHRGRETLFLDDGEVLREKKAGRIREPASSFGWLPETAAHYIVCKHVVARTWGLDQATRE